MQAVDRIVAAPGRFRRGLLVPLLVFGATRLGLALALWAGEVLLPPSRAPGLWFAFPRQLILDGLVRWEAGWYLIVAQQGYHFDAGPSALAPTVFPLFPAIVRLVSLISGDLAFAGLLVANLAFAGSLFLIYRLASRQFGVPVATRAILFFSLFPFSFLLSAAHAESLALLLVTVAFLLLEWGRPLAAALAAALAALTSPAGLLLWPAIVVWHISAFGRGRRSIAGLAGLLLPLLAVGGFAGYLAWVAGEPADLVAATVFGSTRYGLLGGLAPLDSASAELAGFWPVLAGGALLGLLTLAAAAYALRLLGAPYAVFTALAVVVPALLSFDALWRGLILAFPACLVLAYRCRSPLSEQLVVVSSSVALGLLLLLYAGWHPVTHAANAISPTSEEMRRVVRGAGRQPSSAAFALDVELPNVLRLLGYDAPGRAVPGRQLTLPLDVQTLRPSGRPYVISLHLVDREGRTIVNADHLLGSTWELGWTAGDVKRVPLVATIDPTVPSGVYPAELLLFDRETWEALPLVDPLTGQPRTAAVEPITILSEEDSPDPQRLQPQHPIAVALGKQLSLRGYDLSPAAALPGGKVAVTLYWQALAKPDFDYTVFVQLIDERGKLITQSDSYPLGGRYLTSKWAAGALIRDVHELALPPSIVCGSYSLIVGMYRLETMERLTVSDPSGVSAGDYVSLGPVSCEKQ